MDKGHTLEGRGERGEGDGAIRIGMQYHGIDFDTTMKLLEDARESEYFEKEERVLEKRGELGG